MIFGLGLTELVVILVVALVPLAVIVNAIRKERPSAGLSLEQAGPVSRVWRLYSQPYRSYGTVAGRSTIREFWTFSIINALIGWALSGVDIALGLASTVDEVGSVYGVFALITLVPGIAVTVRRLHDSGRSGWWMLIVAIPLVGWLISLYQLVSQGDVGHNRFGDDPRGLIADRGESLGESA